MAFGVSEGEARLWLGLEVEDEAPSEDFLVLAENALAVDVFAALGDCWVEPPMGGTPQRIDRGEMVSTLSLMGVDREAWPKVFGQLRFMQAAAKAAWKEG